MKAEVAQQSPARFDVLKRYRKALLVSLSFLIIFIVTSALTASLINWLKLASYFSNQNTFLFAGQIAIYAVVFAVLLLVTKRLFKQNSIKAIFGLSQPHRYWYFALVPLLFVGYILASQLVALLIAQYVPSFNPSQSQDVGFTFTGAGDRLVAGVMLVLIVPFFEEAVFRGWLFGQVRSYIGFWGTATIVSLMFAYLHGQWNVAIDVFLLSLVLCWLRQKTGSIWVGVSLHALKNLIAFSVLVFSITYR